MQQNNNPGEDLGADRAGNDNAFENAHENRQNGGIREGGDVNQHKKHDQVPGGGLTQDDLPDSTNQSTGATGSGQRQDSN